MQASIVIHRSREAVFACVTTTTFLEQWVTPHKSGTLTMSTERGYFEMHHSVEIPPVRQISQGVLSKGTMFRQAREANDDPLLRRGITDHSLPVTLATIEVTEYEPPAVFAFIVTSKREVSQFRLIFEMAPEGTALTLIENSQFSGWLSRTLASIAPLHFQELNTSNMRGLKAYLEDHC